MNKESIAQLKKHLEEELARLEAEVAQIDTENRESLSEASGENVYRDHMADQGSATFDRELDMTLEENVREALDEVRAALARIALGEYGRCEMCGAEIPIGRMEAVPTASLCIACKSADETH